MVTPEHATPSPTSWVHHWTDASGVALSVGRLRGRHVLKFEDGSHFYFDPGTGTVGVPAPHTQTLRHQLLDHVLPRVLDHLGNLMLHGSAVDTASGAVLFVGESGRGKSTLAASFRSAGMVLLSDDCVRLTNSAGGGVDCLPTYRSLRLWPDSAAILMATSPFEPVASDSDKRRFAYSDGSRTGAVKVAAVCVIAAPSDRSAVDVTPLPPARAVSLLLSQCFRLDPTDTVATRRTFEMCADVVERLPVVELSYPRDYDRLPDVRDAVLRRLTDGDPLTRM